MSSIPVSVTSNILPITDANGFILGRIGIVAGNYNDAYRLKEHLQTAFKALKRLGLSLQGTYFNANAAFDTKEACKTCFNHDLIPNIPGNKGKRLFHPEIVASQ